MIINWVANNNHIHVIETISPILYFNSNFDTYFISCYPNDDANMKYYCDCYLRFKPEIISKNGKNCLFKSSKGQ